MSNKTSRNVRTWKTTPSFKKLDDGAKKQALAFIDKNFLDKNNRDQLMRVATDPNLTKLSPAHQGEVLNAFEKSPGDANHVGNLKAIIGAESYQKMNDAMKTKTMDMIANNATNGRFATTWRK